MHQSFLFKEQDFIKEKVLNWLRQFDTFCFLDSNTYPNSEYEIIVAAGEKRRLGILDQSSLSDLQIFIDEKPSWLFGHLSFETATADHTYISRHIDNIRFPVLSFFEPENLIYIKDSLLNIVAKNPQKIFDEINHTIPSALGFASVVKRIESNFTHNEYIHIIKALKQHIRRGDCYEINFCQEFFAKNAAVDPFNLYEELYKISPNPFSALYRLGDKWLICASPERYLKKTKDLVVSQPIKGTLQRYAVNNDSVLQHERQELFSSHKDRAENVMVVDLVRNDLSRICNEGSVKVDELFGIYSFPQVHQMISTVSGNLKNGKAFTDIIHATFPMGSMTGAPKIRVLELIEKYEKSKRGIFSGSVGYITPEGDFDFNVVIRSIMYNATEKYLSFQAGSGITMYSDPEKEWEECLIKASAIKKILEAKS